MSYILLSLLISRLVVRIKLYSFHWDFPLTIEQNKSPIDQISSRVCFIKACLVTSHFLEYFFVCSRLPCLLAYCTTMIYIEPLQCKMLKDFPLVPKQGKLAIQESVSSIKVTTCRHRNMPSSLVHQFSQPRKNLESLPLSPKIQSHYLHGKMFCTGS